MAYVAVHGGKKMAMRWSTFVAVALFVAAAAPVAGAEPSMAAKSQSHALFERGLAAYKLSKWKEALDSFAGSQETDPGVGTLLYIGECYRQLKKPASAWGAFKEALTLAERLGDKRADVAKQMASEVAPSVSFLTIDVPAGARTEGLVVKRDGAVVSQSLWGTAIPADPDSTVIEASAPGRITSTVTVVVQADGARVVHVVAPLAPAPLQLTPATSAPSVAPPPVKPREVVDTPSHGPFRTPAVVGAAVGVAVAVTGGVLMLSTSLKASQARDDHDVAKYDSVAPTHRTGEVLVGVGLVLATAGAATFYLDPGARSATSVAPAVGPGLAGVLVSSRF